MTTEETTILASTRARALLYLRRGIPGARYDSERMAELCKAYGASHINLRRFLAGAVRRPDPRRVEALAAHLDSLRVEP